MRREAYLALANYPVSLLEVCGFLRGIVRLDGAGKLCLTIFVPPASETGSAFCA